MSQLPISAPTTSREAFAYINAVTTPSMDDLKMMVFLEAAGQSGYYELAQTAPNPAIRNLLEANGREEMAHAHRVCKVIKILSGEDFAPPATLDNPYAAPSGAKVDLAMLNTLVQGETNGCKLYEGWAETVRNPEAAALLRQNAVEETLHGNRASEAITLLAA